MRLYRSLLLSVILFTVGCSGSSETIAAEPDTRRIVQIPTHSGDGQSGGDTAEIAGRLAGSEDEDGGCLWLEEDGVRQPVLWPREYVARFAPVQLLDGNGNVVASEGDAIRGSGGYGPFEEMTRCRLEQNEVARLSQIVTVEP